MDIGVLVIFIIISLMLAIVLKGYSTEFSMLAIISLCICIMIMSLAKIKSLINGMTKIFAYIKIDKTYIQCLVKLIGIAYICEFGAGICKDAGYSAVAAQVVIIGKLTMLLISLPIVMQVLDTILMLL